MFIIKIKKIQKNYSKNEFWLRNDTGSSIVFFAKKGQWFLIFQNMKKIHGMYKMWAILSSEIENKQNQSKKL